VCRGSVDGEGGAGGGTGAGGVVSVEVVHYRAAHGAVLSDGVCEVGGRAEGDAEARGVKGEEVCRLAGRHASGPHRKIFAIEAGDGGADSNTPLAGVVSVLGYVLVALCYAQVEMAVGVAPAGAAFEAEPGAILAEGAVGAGADACFADVVSVQRRGALGDTDGYGAVIAELQIGADGHASAIEVVGEGTRGAGGDTAAGGIFRKEGGRAWRVADQLVAIEIRSGWAFWHAEAGGVVSEEGARACQLAVSSHIVSVPARETFVYAAVGGIVHVEVDGRVTAHRAGHFATLVCQEFILGLAVLTTLLCRRKSVVVR
jgi:hypothetical protein